MWAVGAALLNESKKNGDGQDMWGWSCKEGKRKELFKEEIDYALVCRLQVIAVILGVFNPCLRCLLELGTHLRLH